MAVIKKKILKKKEEVVEDEVALEIEESETKIIVDREPEIKTDEEKSEESEDEVEDIPVGKPKERNGLVLDGFKFVEEVKFREKVTGDLLVKWIELKSNGNTATNCGYKPQDTFVIGDKVRTRNCDFLDDIIEALGSAIVPIYG